MLGGGERATIAETKREAVKLCGMEDVNRDQYTYEQEPLNNDIARAVCPRCHKVLGE